MCIKNYHKGFVFIFGLVCLLLTAAQAQQVSVYLAALELFPKAKLLGIGLVGLLEVILPSVAFLTSIVVFRKLWRRGQILTLLACGYAPWELLRGLLRFAIGMTLLVAWLSHIAGPKALNELRERFELAFDEGQVFPKRQFVLNNELVLGIEQTGVVWGIQSNEKRQTLLRANHGRFSRNERGVSLRLKDVALTSGELYLQTPELRLTLPDDLVSVFPKVLRGTKLIPSQNLDFSRSEHVFAFARRCLLVAMTPTLLFLGAILPGVLPDWILSLAGVALLSVVHVFGRWIELMQLSPALNVCSMALFFGGVMWLFLSVYRRAFASAKGG
ncbi:MAG: LptF/LptG family permease [Bradymonadia bacterium]